MDKPQTAPQREDDREFRKGVPGKVTREIFMANGSYLFCELLEWQPEKKRGKARTPNGRELEIAPMYGTWGEVRTHDRI